jgi:DNA-binding Lrp family transcriptional regulator
MITILDPIDLAICKLLLGNAKMTMKVLGKKIFRSEGAARTRRNNLEESGVIVRHYSLSDSPKFDNFVLTHHHIKLVSNAGDNLKRFIEKTNDIPRITNCLYVAADDYDFIVMVESPSLIENYRTITVELCQGLDIQSITNVVVISETRGKTGNSRSSLNK